MEYLNKRTTGLSIGQITLLEIAVSSGIFASVSYALFLFSIFKRSITKLSKILSKYKGLLGLLCLNIFLLGFTTHYMDKLPRTILLYFTFMGWFNAYKTSFNKIGNEDLKSL